MLKKNLRESQFQIKPPVRTLQKPKQAKFEINKIKIAPELVTYSKVY